MWIPDQATLIIHVYKNYSKNFPPYVSTWKQHDYEKVYRYYNNLLLYWNMSPCLQEHVAVGLKTRSSQLVSSQSLAVAIFCLLCTFFFGLKVISQSCDLKWIGSKFYQFCWHSSLVLKVTFNVENNVSIMWKSLCLGAGTRIESIHRLFNHVANLVPRLSPPPVYLHTVSNQALNGEDLGTKVMLNMKKSQHWHVSQSGPRFQMKLKPCPLTWTGRVTDHFQETFNCTHIVHHLSVVYMYNDFYMYQHHIMISACITIILFLPATMHMKYIYIISFVYYNSKLIQCLTFFCHLPPSCLTCIQNFSVMHQTQLKFHFPCTQHE